MMSIRHSEDSLNPINKMKDDNVGMEDLKKLWNGADQKDKNVMMQLGFGVGLIFILSIVVLGASLHIMHTTDSDEKEVNKGLYQFLLVGLYVTILAPFLSGSVGQGKASIFGAMFGLAVQVSLIYFIRTDLRPNAEELDHNKKELDFIEYGIYSMYGAIVLLGGYAYVRRDSFVNIIMGSPGSRGSFRSSV